MKRTGLEALRGDLAGCERRHATAVERAERLRTKWEATRIAMEDARGEVYQIEAEQHALVSAIRELEKRPAIVRGDASYPEGAVSELAAEA